MPIVPKKIATQATLLCIIAMTLLILSGYSSLTVSERLVADIEKTRIFGAALRHHTVGDMVHDGLRGVAYSALAAGRTRATRGEIGRQFESYAAEYARTQAAIAELDLPQETDARLEAGRAPFKAFVAATGAMVEQAFSGEAEALASLPRYEAQFAALAILLDDAGDALEQQALATELASKDYVASSNLLSMIIRGLALAGVGLLAAFVIFFMVRRLRKVHAAMLELANGNMEVDVGARIRADEIGDMTRAIITFRDNGLKKQELEQQSLSQKAAIGVAQTQAELERQRMAAMQAETAGRQAVLIQILGDALGRLARGDFTVDLQVSADDVFHQIKHDLNGMAAKIRAIARRISGVTQEVHGAAAEIAAGVDDLAARTEHQASTLEETSASMEQLAATVSQNAGNAREANQAAAEARDAAAGGGEIAVRAVAAMSRIDASTHQISDIIGLIQDIAFQTNLLALNAAVEAARAGEAGRGFAVVANEVRALAQRAEQASKDIKRLIANSGNEVREGVSLVTQAGASLTGIVSTVSKVASLMSEISAATQEQSLGIGQVSKAVSGMDQMTQQNAALVEETNAALHSARHQIDALREAVGFFRTGEAGAPDEVLDHANPVRRNLRSLARRISDHQPSRAGSIRPAAVRES